MSKVVDKVGLVYIIESFVADACEVLNTDWESFLSHAVNITFFTAYANPSSAGVPVTQ